MNKILKSNEGFTILEVVVAVSILTIGILAVASMQVAAMRGNSFAWGTSEASTVAMSQVESLMGLSYGDAQLANGSHPIITSGRYSIRWDVVDDRPIAGSKTVTVRVSWTEYSLNRNLSLNFTVGQVV